MRISDWSSDVCSSDLDDVDHRDFRYRTRFSHLPAPPAHHHAFAFQRAQRRIEIAPGRAGDSEGARHLALVDRPAAVLDELQDLRPRGKDARASGPGLAWARGSRRPSAGRSEEHNAELHATMRRTEA